MMCLSYSALAAPDRMEITIKSTPLLRVNRMPSLLLERLSSHSAAITATTPPHCHMFSFSPKRIREKATTSTGLVALRVLAVVMGRVFSAARPEIQEVVTRIPLKKSARWSFGDPCPRKGLRKSADRAVAPKSTKRTPLRFNDCFLATSYTPRRMAEPNVIHTHIAAAKLQKNSQICML